MTNGSLQRVVWHTRHVFLGIRSSDEFELPSRNVTVTARSRPHLHRSPQFLLRCMWYYCIAYLDLAHAPSSSCPRSFKNVYFLNELHTKRVQMAAKSTTEVTSR